MWLRDDEPEQLPRGALAGPGRWPPHQPTNVLLPILRRHKNFSIRNGANVRRVVHKNSRAAGVTYIDEHGEEVMQPASVVIL